MEVNAAIANDQGRKCRVLLIDLKVGSPDEDDRKLVGRSGPRLTVMVWTAPVMRRRTRFDSDQARRQVTAVMFALPQQADVADHAC